MIDFSIIIPVYNAEKTLERCLDSVDSQTFLNYEVIVVDDGSTDRSLSICKQYEMQNQRYHVVHQLNSGPSTARNMGLNMAIGKWICFIDSDDFVEESYLQDIFDTEQKSDADVVFVGYNKVYENGKKEVCFPYEFSDANFETFFELSEQDMFGYTWVKAFRREVIKDIKFNSDLNLFEDEVFTCQVIPNCKRISIVKKPIYNYNVGDGSSLIGRTHEDYCLKCDMVYNAWKHMLGGSQEIQYLMLKKANEFVSRCYYYAFERQVDIQTFFSQLKRTAFFLEHTDIICLDDAVRNSNYKKLYFEKIKYQMKVKLSLILHGNR